MNGSAWLVKTVVDSSLQRNRFSRRPAHPDSGEATTPDSESLLADEPVRNFSFVGLFNGAPDLSERSEEILREEFAKRADADR